MDQHKNINVNSHFNNRIGIIVWLKTKKNVKKLMNYGFLHYVSDKMNYAVLYVNEEEVETIIEKLKRENIVKSVEFSKIKDLPIEYESVIKNLKKEIEKNKEVKNELFD